MTLFLLPSTKKCTINYIFFVHKIKVWGLDLDLDLLTFVVWTKEISTICLCPIK